jgi:rRNA maturation endonuclease Nob1
MIEKHISTILDERNQDELMQLIINTFEKQVSKQTTLDLNGRYVCTECDDVVIKSFSFCPHCGQKLKWE